MTRAFLFVLACFQFMTGVPLHICADLNDSIGLYKTSSRLGRKRDRKAYGIGDWGRDEGLKSPVSCYFQVFHNCSISFLLGLSEMQILRLCPRPAESETPF